MDRRKFLALGIGAAGAGAIGGGVVGRATAQTGGVPMPSGDDPGSVADVTIEQPLVPHKGTHRVLWSLDVSEPRAALTFDDGPDPDFTPAILDILADHGVRATFMMMGFNVAQHAEIARAVVAAGHEVGNHTWSHLNLLKETGQRQYEELVRAHDTIEEVTGVRCAYFRPPRGQLTGPSLRHAAVLGYDTILWSVDRGSPGVSTPEALVDFAAVHLGPGDIVDLHDGVGRGTFEPDAEWARGSRARREVEVLALPQILADAAARGLAVGSVGELLAVEAASGSGRDDAQVEGA